MSTQRELFEATNKIPYSTEFSEIMCRYVTKNTELTDQIIQARWEGWQKAVKANNIDVPHHKDTIRKLTELLNVATKLLDARKDELEIALDGLEHWRLLAIKWGYEEV